MSEFLDIAQAASTALAQGETVCLATVVRVRGSAPRHTGARLLIWPDGVGHRRGVPGRGGVLHLGRSAGHAAGPEWALPPRSARREARRAVKPDRQGQQAGTTNRRSAGDACWLWVYHGVHDGLSFDRPSPHPGGLGRCLAGLQFARLIGAVAGPVRTMTPPRTSPIMRLMTALRPSFLHAPRAYHGHWPVHYHRASHACRCRWKLLAGTWRVKGRPVTNSFEHVHLMEVSAMRRSR